MSTTTTVRTGLAGLLDRVTSVVRLIRPVEEPRPPYTRCSGCLQGGRDDQKVPDPDQYAKKPGVETASINGGPAVTKDAEIKLVDAAPLWCVTCRAWFHAIGCFSLHRTDRH